MLENVQFKLIVVLLLPLFGCVTAGETGSEAATAAVETQLAADSRSRLFIVGQDLSAIRGYMNSDCCPRPDGVTAYLDFFALLEKEGGYGGLGIDAAGKPLDMETSWGAGPVSAYKSATEFGIDDIAIGLSITENNHPGGLDRLVAGEYDANIEQLARFATMVSGKMYLRIGYEFDGAWNHGYENAPRFINAYRRIVDGMRSAGAGNVEFVWQGAASTTDAVIDGGRHDNIADWYPGDAYVDWLALSWFMHPDEKPGIDFGFPVPTPRQLGDEILELARSVNKPVMIAEAAPQAYDLRDNTTSHHAVVWDGDPGTETTNVTDEEIWDNWFGPMFDYINNNADVIRALAYIDVRWDDQSMWGPPYAGGYWGDTRVESNPHIAKRFSAAIRAWRGDDDI